MKTYLVLISLMFGTIAILAVYDRTTDSATIYCEHMDYYIIKTQPQTIKVQCVAPIDN